MPDITDTAKLREFIVAHFDWEELRTLCQDIDVDFDTLRGEGKRGKARELVAYMERRLQLEKLVTALSKHRQEAWQETGLDRRFRHLTSRAPRTPPGSERQVDLDRTEKKRPPTTNEAKKSKPAFTSAPPLISSFIGFLVGVLGNLIAAWIQQDLLANAFTLPRIALIVLLAAVGLGAGVWIQRQQPLDKKQWGGISAILIVLMILSIIVLVLEKEKNANHPPSIQNLVASPSTLNAGQQATLTVLAADKDQDSLAYYWEAQRGTVPAGAQGATVLYTAPASSGLDRIKVTVTDGQASTSQEIRFSVLSGDAGEP